MAQSGMDLLVGSLLKASGLDMEKVKSDIVQFGQQLNARIQSMDEAIKQLRDEQMALRETLEGMGKGQVTVTNLLVEVARATKNNGVVKQ